MSELYADGTEFVVSFTTVTSIDEARNLAKGLINEGIAACVSLIPGVESHFRFQTEVRAEKEIVLMIKGRRANILRLNEWITHHHSYEVPELIHLPLVAGLPAYFEWIRTETPPAPEAT